jgi:multidrug efflux pump subunit AcrA (membrane-fusion protein)
VRKDQLWVRAFVPETDLGFLRDNQKVQVQVDSFPDVPFEGTVLRINRLGEFTPRNVQTFRERQDMLFGIKIRVQDAKGILRPGMAATVYVKK